MYIYYTVHILLLYTCIYLAFVGCNVGEVAYYDDMATCQLNEGGSGNTAFAGEGEDKIQGGNAVLDLPTHSCTPCQVPCEDGEGSEGGEGTCLGVLAGSLP